MRTISMTDFLFDINIDSNCNSDFLENNFRSVYNDESDIELSMHGLDNDREDIYGFGNIDRNSLLNNGVHSVFNEIAHLKPTNSSSSDEDDKNCIMSWELNEQNFDTLPSSPVCYIKQEYKEEEELIIYDSDRTECSTSVSSNSPTEFGFKETSPVSPEIKPVTVNDSLAPVNILVIDSVTSGIPSPKIFPVSSSNCNGRRLVPATPLRSQARKNCIIKVPLENEEIEESKPEVQVSIKCDSEPIAINKISLGISAPPGNSESSLLGKNITLLSANQMKAVKRQQRMIKNRESASLSRKKKKEYVATLENKLDQMAKENSRLKAENKILKDKLSVCETSLWKKHGKLIDNSKKITALFAVMFMISFNVASYRSFPNSDNDKISPEEGIFTLNSNPDYHKSRSLLWTDQTIDNLTSSSSEFSNWKNSSDLKCPMFINQTESLRLDSELRKWIDAYPADNTTNTLTKFSNDSKLTFWPLIFSSQKREKKNPVGRRFHPTAELSRNANRGVEIFGLNNNIFDVNEPLYQAMDRKQDTFYVVSFSGDHLLLPAISHNQTLRPKMSLVLPSVTANSSYSADTITMMQIDCTVTDTRMIYMKQKDIPAHLKSASLKNVQKSNTSYPKQGLRQKYNPAYSLHETEKNYLPNNI